ncbi:MAG: YjbQ family protein [Nitrospirae bacterium]|nr:YjbQ family protein [Nitrospirota bacterium]
MTQIDIKSSKRQEMINITSSVASKVLASGIKKGLCIVYVPHTTAGVTINESADPAVRNDLINTLNRLIPKDPSYEHAEGNSDSHVKSTLVGVSATVPIEQGRMMLGIWQAIYFCEFDGPRSRHVDIKIIEG